MLQVPFSFVFSSGVNSYHAINVVCGCHCGINVDLFYVFPLAATETRPLVYLFGVGGRGSVEDIDPSIITLCFLLTCFFPSFHSLVIHNLTQLLSSLLI